MSSLNHVHKKRCVVLPTSTKREVYAGFIQTSNGECFRIGMSCMKGGGQVNPKSLVVDEELRIRLKPFLSSLIGRAQHTQTIDSFLRELADLTEQATMVSLTEKKENGVRNNAYKRTNSSVPAQFYELILNEMEDLGWSRVLDINAESRIVTISSTDDGKRLHELTLVLPVDYPFSPPECHTDIPCDFFPKAVFGNKKTPQSLQMKAGISPIQDVSAHASSSSSSSSSSASVTTELDNQFNLVSIVSQWEDCLKQYQSLWDQFDDLDDHTWVLEPQRNPPAVSTNQADGAGGTNNKTIRIQDNEGRPARRLLFRRIAIAPHASILFDVDIDFPHRVPKNIKFLGKDSVIAPLRASFGSNVGTLWDGSGRTSLRSNLQKCLGIETLPSPLDAKKSNNSVGGGNEADEYRSECAICYTYRLNLNLNQGVDIASNSSSTAAPTASSSIVTGDSASSSTSIPNIVCSNPKCNRSYHNHCLYEWLCGLPNATRSFGTIFGHCPYCFVSISVGLK